MNGFRLTTGAVGYVRAIFAILTIGEKTKTPPVNFVLLGVEFVYWTLSLEMNRFWGVLDIYDSQPVELSCTMEV